MTSPFDKLRVTRAKLTVTRAKFRVTRAKLTVTRGELGVTRCAVLVRETRAPLMRVTFAVLG